jgi:hypothetical protein
MGRRSGVGPAGSWTPETHSGTRAVKKHDRHDVSPRTHSAHTRTNTAPAPCTNSPTTNNKRPQHGCSSTVTSHPTPDHRLVRARAPASGYHPTLCGCCVRRWGYLAPAPPWAPTDSTPLNEAGQHRRVIVRRTRPLEVMSRSPDVAMGRQGACESGGRPAQQGRQSSRGVAHAAERSTHRHGEDPGLLRAPTSALLGRSGSIQLLGLLAGAGGY